MDVSVSLVELLLLVAAAFGAGFVDAIAGGGGLLTLPALLAAGLPPQQALATNKGGSVFGSGAALIRFSRAGLMDKKRASVGFPIALLGALAGAALVLRFSSTALRPVVLVLLIVAAAVVTLRPPKVVAANSAPAPRPTGARMRALAATIAFCIGAYDGFFGPGTGTFLILLFVALLGDSLREASANAKVVNFASNLASALLFAAKGLVLWKVALPMAAAQFAGGTLGAHWTVRGGDRIVRRAVLAVVSALALKIGWDLWSDRRQNASPSVSSSHSLTFPGGMNRSRSST